MADTHDASASSSVQCLIDRIRGDGVKAGREEADQILRKARAEAEAMRAKAQAEARDMVAAAKAEVARERAAGVEALKNAGRDAFLELRNNVRHAFEQHIQHLVSQQTSQGDFLRSIVLVLAGQAADRYITDHDATIFVAGSLAGPQTETPSEEAVRRKIRDAVLGASGEMLRQGIDLLPDDAISGGARVRLVDQNLEIDLTDKGVTRLLLKYLLPRYQAIIQEESR